MERKKENSFSTKLIFAVILIVIVCSLGVIVFDFFYGPLEVRTLDVKFSVEDKMGFDLTKNDSLLSFGTTFPGSSVIKSMTIENERNFPIKVRAFASDEISPYLKIDGETIIPLGENRSIGFVLNLAKNMSFGNYSGKIVLKMYR